MIRADPNRTLIPGLVVDAVVVEPWGAHPSYAQGYYDRDNDFYVAWEAISRDAARAASATWTSGSIGVPDRAEYLASSRAGGGLTERLRRIEPACAPGVNYGY